jgi:hypothetical protein
MRLLGRGFYFDYLLWTSFLKTLRIIKPDAYKSLFEGSFTTRKSFIDLTRFGVKHLALMNISKLKLRNDQYFSNRQAKAPVVTLWYESCNDIK